MIIFQTDNIKIDLSHFGVSLAEENPLFSDNIYKSYSVPFTVPAEEELLDKLGLPHLENVSSVETMVRGKLILPYRYYDAVLYLGEIEGQQIECNISFGDQELAVYDMHLKDLPWPTQLVLSYITLVNSTIVQSWPDVAYNFPRIYRPDIREKPGYESFQGFVNNHNSLGPIQNVVDNSGAEPVYHNKNVLAPFPYLLEILRFIFHQEGKTVSGDLFNDENMKQALFIPENYLEKFKGSEYQTFSFETPKETVAGIGVYEKRLVPEMLGTYEIDYKLNLDPVTANFFEFRIYQEDAIDGYKINTLFEAKSENNRVRLSDQLKVNITSENQYGPIVVELKLKDKEESIAEMNQFEYSFSEGKLNEGPNSFTLADFMPDMTAGEFVNELKNWLNLDIDIQEGQVEINYTQRSILKKPREDHRHMEVTDVRKSFNSNKFFKLTYANGDEVFYSSKGQIYSGLDEKSMEIVPIEMDVLPAIVERNENVMTAVFPENRAGIVFCLYDSSGIPENRCSPEIARNLDLQKVFQQNWEEWLRYRINSKTFRESFECSVHELIDINSLMFKYNELHVIKKLQRKFISSNVMRVDLESETF